MALFYATKIAIFVCIYKFCIKFLPILALFYATKDNISVCMYIPTLNFCQYWHFFNAEWFLYQPSIRTELPKRSTWHPYPLRMPINKGTARGATSGKTWHPMWHPHVIPSTASCHQIPVPYPHGCVKRNVIYNGRTSILSCLPTL